MSKTVKEVAIQLKNVRDKESFKKKCVELGFRFIDDGLDEGYNEDCFYYFNMDIENEILGKKWFWIFHAKKEISVETEEELFYCLKNNKLKEKVEFLDLVSKFSESFSVINNDNPSLISDDDWKLRKDLGQEELDEYEDACKANDLKGVLDSLVDQSYILFGTVLKHGLQDVFLDAFREVHSSNMSKLDDDGKPIINDGVLNPNKPVGKILKSKNFFEPNLEQFLNEKS